MTSSIKFDAAASHTRLAADCGLRFADADLALSVALEREGLARAILEALAELLAAAREDQPEVSHAVLQIEVRGDRVKLAAVDLEVGK